MQPKEYYYAYEQFLLGYNFSKMDAPVRNYPRGCFADDMPASEKKAKAVLILQYAFRDILKWDADTCRVAINQEILDTMQLSNLKRYLDIPEEYNGKVDPVYFAHLIYPEKVTFDRDKLVIDIYKEVLEEKEINGKKRCYPKKFFQDEDGRKRAIQCMSYALRNNTSFRNIEEVYETLSDKSKKFLKDNKLLLAEWNFDTPIDYLQDSLAEGQQDDFLFAYYKFKYLFNRPEKLPG